MLVRISIDSARMDSTRTSRSYNQLLDLPCLAEMGVQLSVKREDLIHPLISGNKWRKCYYNIKRALAEKADAILTFGGAHSNHIAAVSAAARESGLLSIGVIRGEELEGDNPTLRFAQEQGMELRYVSRTAYRESKEVLALEHRLSTRTYVIPEGGANPEGVKGCREILSTDDLEQYDVVTCCAGTGSTAAGLWESMQKGQVLRVYPALKGVWMRDEIERHVTQSAEAELTLSHSYHFGGYAKTSPLLHDFIKTFYKETHIPLDPIYTAKMMYGLAEEIRSEQFSRGTRILAIHTGGLQGVAGIEEREGITLYDKPYPWSEY